MRNQDRNVFKGSGMFIRFVPAGLRRSWKNPEKVMNSENMFSRPVNVLEND